MIESPAVEPPAEPAVAAADPLQGLEKVTSFPASPTELVVIEGSAKRPRVVQYSDWKCPHCFDAIAKMNRASMRAKSTLVYRNFPLAGPCNPTIERADEERCRLASASICAHQIERFWDLVESAEADPATATEGFADNPKFQRCMAAPETLQAVQQQAKTGVELKLMGTPTLYVQLGDDWYTGQVPDVITAIEHSATGL